MMTTYNGAYRRIDIVTDTDIANRRSNLLAKPLKEFPAAVINGSTINVYPQDITSAEFTYLKQPNTPVYDYYIDVYKNLVYLPSGATHTLLSGETGSAGQTSGVVTSLTVELEWNELYHITFAGEVLQRVGINLKDEQLMQYANQVKA